MSFLNATRTSLPSPRRYSACWADAILPDTACQICEILLGAAQRFFRCGSSTLMTNITGAVIADTRTSPFSHDPMKRFNFKSAPLNIQHLIQLCPGLSCFDLVVV
jgi:hypothetical protein